MHVPNVNKNVTNDALLVTQKLMCDNKERENVCIKGETAYC